MDSLVCDIVVVGASIGGLRAAISGAEIGKKVVLIEQTDWIGGQFTIQAVPPDENQYIEDQGCTQSYKNFRNKIRDHYRQMPNVSDEIKNKNIFDPGNSWVGFLSHEPKISLSILQNEMQQYVKKGLLLFIPFSKAIHATVINDSIKNIIIYNIHNNVQTQICAKIFIDGTDTGDLLPIVNAEYVTGAESKEQTKEPHAVDIASPMDMQPVTHVFALEMMDQLSNCDKIQKPQYYDYYSSLKATYDNNDILSWYCIDFTGKKKRELRMFNGELNEHSLGLWEYRRVKAQSTFKDKINEISLINWPQQDYIFGNIFDCEDAEFHKRQAKEFALCLAYWIQNVAPRKDGGFGYPVRLAKDFLGTDDGFAKMPYIRESRRIVAKYTIVEQDVSRACSDKIKICNDSIGVGFYSMDFHETIITHTSLNEKTNPFEIPLGAVIPVRITNLLPACKNIGTTHITSSCYRLHPIEWNIGESVGYLAGFCLDNNILPSDVYYSQKFITSFQKLLKNKGIQLHWDL